MIRTITRSLNAARGATAGWLQGLYVDHAVTPCGRWRIHAWRLGVRLYH